jgi:tRNA(Ile)-lysidine synthase
MDILEKVKRTIDRYGMLFGGERIMVGLSGGPDSVCLLHILKELSPSFRLGLMALYVDHGLRPEETAKEIEFCKEVCKGLGVEFFIKSVDTRGYAEEHSLSIQEAARRLRYWMFEQTALEAEADRIATGHNADDQAETVVMRLLRGSGMKGLGAIPPVRGKVIRPLLEVQRQEIEQYLTARGIQWLTDSSNLSDKYLRNRIRKELMPVLKRFNPKIVETLCRTAALLREENEYIEARVNSALMKLISRRTDKKVELFLAPLENMERVILRRALRRAIDETKGLRGIGFEHIEEIIDMIQSAPTGARLYLPRGIRVIKGYSTLIITAERPQKLSEYVLQVPGETVLKEAGLVLISSISEKVEGYGDGKTEAVFDLDTLSFPLKIRPRKEGDFFYPFGFGKRKKLQDFFVDEKVPKEERDTVPILTSEDKIVWVVGYRTDERFKVTSSTRRVLRIVVRLSRFETA